MKTTEKAPRHLSSEAREIWEGIVSAWELERHAFIVLATSLEAFDRMRQAQAQIKKEGPVVNDRFGQPKVHPSVLIERDSRAAVLNGFKALGLSLEPIQPNPNGS